MMWLILWKLSRLVFDEMIDRLYIDIFTWTSVTVSEEKAIQVFQVVVPLASKFVFVWCNDGETSAA